MTATRFPGTAIRTGTPPRRDHEQPDRLVYDAAFLAAALAVLALSAWLRIDPDGTVVFPVFDLPLPSACWFRRVTGIDCPGCGLTRSFVSIADGQLGSAWSYNPAGFPIFLGVLFQLPYRMLQLVRSHRGLPPWHARRPSYLFAIASLAFLLVQWVHRNMQ